MVAREWIGSKESGHDRTMASIYNVLLGERETVDPYARTLELIESNPILKPLLDEEFVVYGDFARDLVYILRMTFNRTQEHPRYSKDDGRVNRAQLVKAAKKYQQKLFGRMFDAESKYSTGANVLWGYFDENYSTKGDYKTQSLEEAISGRDLLSMVGSLGLAINDLDSSFSQLYMTYFHNNYDGILIQDNMFNAIRGLVEARQLEV